MNRLELPVNIALMNTGPANMNRLMKITTLDTFEGGSLSSTNYHPEGLFSIEIFGRVGSERRNVTFARIDTKARIIHPFIYKKLVKMRGLYKEIIHGKAFAKWNDELKDFEPSNIIDGETGYNFFMTHLPQIEFKLTGSAKREINVTLLKEAIGSGLAFTNSIPVIPAGMRDIYIEADGRVNEDEINSRYRSLLASANALPDGINLEDSAYDTTRVTLQNALNAIFDYLWNIYEGKNGFAAKRFYASALENGTRNVLSAADLRIDNLGDKNAPGINHTVVGLFQVMKAILPIAQYRIMNGWLGEAFSAGYGKAYLVNPKTLHSELITVPRRLYDRFFTPDGIANLIDRFFDRAFRKKPVEIAGYYVGLVYRGKVDGKDVFKFFKDIDELPNGFDKRDVKPITYVELFYVAGYRVWNKHPMMFTRYPVAGLGSTYPSYFYTKTTTTGIKCYELDDDWKIKTFDDDNEIKFAYEYPDLTIDKYVETAMPSPTRLAGASADFDGDLGSQNGIYTEEAMNQVNEYLKSARAYLSPRGGLLNSPMVETTQRVLAGLMRR